MYWWTRSSMTFHAETTTMTVMNAVSRTNQTERPSTPSVYQTLKRAIQACFSANCIAAVPRLNPVTSGIVTAKLAVAAISAAQRTASARSSRPKARSRTPATMGSQMAMLRSGMFLLFAERSAPDHVAEERPELPGHEADHADDHDQRIPVEIAALQAPAERGDAADRPRRAIDEDAVDGGDVTALPEALPRHARGAGEHVLVEPVEVVLVVEHAVQERE